jgi:nucleotide-binding universal stress UspA family protein
MNTRTTTTVFDRVVCGVDGSEAGVVAARAAGLVTAPDGALTLVSANDPSVAVHAGWNMAQVLEELAAESETALERGSTEAKPLHPLESKLIQGDPMQVLLGEIDEQDATAVVVGSHGLSRTTGIALGAVSTHLLHEAPCAVLVARKPVEVERWPRRIVVGVDGSADSAAAYAAAQELGDRYGVEVRAIVATKGAQIDLDGARRIAPGCEEHDARALDILNVASESASLVVVGSRGLRGLRALGSLSERLAHEARCSVLVVRPGA